jgi:hypothetical protein
MVESVKAGQAQDAQWSLDCSAGLVCGDCLCGPVSGGVPGFGLPPSLPGGGPPRPRPGLLSVLGGGSPPCLCPWLPAWAGFSRPSVPVPPGWDRWQEAAILSAPPAPSARAFDVAASIFLCLSAPFAGAGRPTPVIVDWIRHRRRPLVRRRVLHPGHLWLRRQHPPFRHVGPAADQGWVSRRSQSRRSSGRRHGWDQERARWPLRRCHRSTGPPRRPRPPARSADADPPCQPREELRPAGAGSPPAVRPAPPPSRRARPGLARPPWPPTTRPPRRIPVGLGPGKAHHPAAARRCPV